MLFVVSIRTLYLLIFNIPLSIGLGILSLQPKIYPISCSIKTFPCELGQLEDSDANYLPKKSLFQVGLDSLGKVKKKYEDTEKSPP